MIHIDFCYQNVANQLVAEDCDVPGSRYEKVFLANEKVLGRTNFSIKSNLEHLKSGPEDYVLLPKLVIHNLTWQELFSSLLLRHLHSTTCCIIL